MLVLTVSEDLHELLQDGGPASVAPLGKLRRVVVVTVDLPFVFVIAVLRAENGWAHRAREMFNVILSLQGGDVGSPESAAAIEAQQIESAEVVGLAQGILAFAFFVVNGEEFRSYYLSAVLDTVVSIRVVQHTADGAYPAFEALQMKRATESPHKLPGQWLVTLLTQSQRM